MMDRQRPLSPIHSDLPHLRENQDGAGSQRRRRADDIFLKRSELAVTVSQRRAPNARALIFRACSVAGTSLCSIHVLTRRLVWPITTPQTTVVLWEDSRLIVNAHVRNTMKMDTTDQLKSDQELPGTDAAEAGDKQDQANKVWITGESHVDVLPFESRVDVLPREGAVLDDPPFDPTLR
ncbi:hypothetical protein WMY93_017987 [Mugilogobius chulae]|uniref:Uncharacterized protein n=1 Tax=Mugilogobius chulae TaxID=88201 RepID=A0AAW0NIR2_9GOBI